MAASSAAKKLRPAKEGRRVYWPSEEGKQILGAAMNGDIDTLVSMSHKGIDVTTACDGERSSVIQYSTLS